MLVRDDGGSWTVITQPAHAHLAALVAAHWGDPPPGPDVLLGIEQHDVAWTTWDRTPPLHAPAGRAAAFFEAPAGPRLEIWRDVAAHLDALNPYAALLVSLHATNIHTRYVPAEHRPADFLDAQRADQDRLLALLPDATRAQAEADAELLFAVDALSLTLCFGWEARDLPVVDGPAVHLAPADDGSWTLDPWPLDVPELVVGVHARRLTERFEDEAAMQQALAATPNHRETWRLRPV
jgi:hypothetical protein